MRASFHTHTHTHILFILVATMIWFEDWTFQDLLSDSSFMLLPTPATSLSSPEMGHVKQLDEECEASRVATQEKAKQSCIYSQYQILDHTTLSKPAALTSSSVLLTSSPINSHIPTKRCIKNKCTGWYLYLTFDDSIPVRWPLFLDILNCGRIWVLTTLTNHQIYLCAINIQVWFRYSLCILPYKLSLHFCRISCRMTIHHILQPFWSTVN